MTTRSDPDHVHHQRFDGDDPYLVCYCGQRWDALTGAPTASPTQRRDAPLTAVEVAEIRRSVRSGHGNGGGTVEWNARWLATLDAGGPTHDNPE